MRSASLNNFASSCYAVNALAPSSHGTYNNGTSYLNYYVTGTDPSAVAAVDNTYPLCIGNKRIPTNFPDGTSNTIFWVEKYAQCGPAVAGVKSFTFRTHCVWIGCRPLPAPSVEFLPQSQQRQSESPRQLWDRGDVPGAAQPLGNELHDPGGQYLAFLDSGLPGSGVLQSWVAFRKNLLKLVHLTIGSSPLIFWEGFAMAAIVDFRKWSVVAHDFGDLLPNEPQRRHFAEYLTGLFVARRKNVSGINREFAQTTDPVLPQPLS